MTTGTRTQGQIVTDDAQFGVVKILRPYSGFEAVYQGKSATAPIQFTEGGVAAEPQAGQPGYSTQLLNALPVPMGARALIWLPAIASINITDSNLGTTVKKHYSWILTWRLRNVADFRRVRGPYHYPRQGLGVPDTYVLPAPGSKPRVVRPAAWSSVIYPEEQTAYPDYGEGVVHQVRSQFFEMNFPNTGIEAPLMPGGGATNIGFYQQGILDPGATADPVAASDPSFTLIDTTCFGDELMVGLIRTRAQGSNWNFNLFLQDKTISNLFGTGNPSGPFPDIGVYVCLGKVST